MACTGTTPPHQKPILKHSADNISLLTRSGHPLAANFPMLERLHLKTIVYLAETELHAVNHAWCAQHGITLHHFRVQPVREPFVENNPLAVEATLALLLDKRNFPILLHSNKGKHRVGVLVGCMRKVLQGWSLAAIHAEYGRFAGDKGDADLEFIELFKPKNLDLDKTEWSPQWLRVQ
jgi:tyrosine-protein phosphatase-like protein OCA2